MQTKQFSTILNVTQTTKILISKFYFRGEILDLLSKPCKMDIAKKWGKREAKKAKGKNEIETRTKQNIQNNGKIQ